MLKTRLWCGLYLAALVLTVGCGSAPSLRYNMIAMCTATMTADDGTGIFFHTERPNAARHKASPVVEAEMVLFGTPKDGGELSISYPAYTDTQGQARLFGVRQGAKEEDWSLRMEVTCEGYESVSRVFEPKEARAANLTVIMKPLAKKPVSAAASAAAPTSKPDPKGTSPVAPTATLEPIKAATPAPRGLVEPDAAAFELAYTALRKAAASLKWELRSIHTREDASLFPPGWPKVTGCRAIRVLFPDRRPGERLEGWIYVVSAERFPSEALRMGASDDLVRAAYVGAAKDYQFFVTRARGLVDVAAFTEALGAK